MITATNTELLVGLQDPQNSGAWNQFFDRYQKLLISFGRRLGLNETDAEDAAQEALVAFAAAYREGKYDRTKGRLRTWLSGIATNKIRDVQRRRRSTVQLPDSEEGQDPFQELPDQSTMDEVWDEEWKQSVLKACLQEVRQHVEPRTMQAFELFVFQDWPAERVAEHLKISVDSVFQAKTRILKRMRKVREYMEQNW